MKKNDNELILLLCVCISKIDINKLHCVKTIKSVLMKHVVTLGDMFIYSTKQQHCSCILAWPIQYE